MTDSERITYIRALCNGSTRATDTLLSALLTKAKDAVFRRLYPWGVPSDVTDVPTEYEIVTCELASRYFYRIGADGQTGHSENGVSRSWGSVNDSDILQQIVPYAKVVG